ncbi:MAG: hypothetical protein AAFV26_10190 [Pseudomonadota bacterium]
MAGGGRHTGQPQQSPHRPPPQASELDQRSNYTLEDDAFDDDDTPMPIPSTWRPQPAPEPPKRGALAAALGGFTLGLLMVIPAVIYVTGRGDAVVAEAQRMYAAAVETVSANATSGESVVARSSADADGPVTLTPDGQPEDPPLLAGAIKPADNTMPSAALTPEIVVSDARRLIAEGELVAARELLEATAPTGHPDLLFALAETYDPNVLAAWGLSGVSPDVSRARTAYRAASRAGSALAAERLEALR